MTDTKPTLEEQIAYAQYLQFQINNPKVSAILDSLKELAAALLQREMESEGYRKCAEGQGTSQFCSIVEKLKDDLMADGWRSIESAPKDGREVLAYYGHQGGVKKLVSFNKVHGYWQSKGDVILGFMENATHWMPLPNPPSKERK